MVVRAIERDIVGAFIVSADDQILLGHAAVYEGRWGVPGGGIEAGETRLQAVEREVLEETGIDIRQAVVEELPDVALGQSEKTLRETGERVMVKMRFYDFLVRLTQKASEITVIAEDDFADAIWFTLDELGSLPLTPPSNVRLQKLGFIKK